MQSLSCDLWLMERGAFRQFMTLAAATTIPAGEQARALTKAEPTRRNSVAVIPVTGALEARPTMMGYLMGMTSYEDVGRMIDAAMSEDSVTSVVLDVASPGGMVYGAQELADKIYRYRGKKPMIAVANPLAASGAYWIAAAADRVVASPSADVGSVGVIAEHVDMSAAYDREGAKVTVVRSDKSPFKGEGTDSEPLSQEALAHMQGRANAIYERFSGDLAKFRGVTVEHVVERFGKGRIVDSRSALNAGMVDRVATLQQITDGLLSGRIRLSSERAQDVWDGKTSRDQIAERLTERVQAINQTIAAFAVKPTEN